jgi:hypothetical protein
MSPRLRSLAGLAWLASSLCGCTSPTLDHYWDYDRCQATFVKPGETTGTSRPVAAYLRRADGASSLVIELSDRGGIASPYASGPVVRFAISPKEKGPSSLKVVPDASDVRGPVSIAPGTAWLLTSPTTDQTKPGDDWRVGSGTLALTSLSLVENDTSARDFVTLDADLDLSGVIATPIGPAGAPGQPVGGAVHIHCVDQPITATGAGGAGGAGGSIGVGGTGGAPDTGGSSGAGGAAGSSSLPMGTLVTPEQVMAVGVADTGVGWLVRQTQPGFPDSGVARYLGASGAPLDVGASLHLGDTDRIQLAGLDVFFTTAAGLWRATPPGMATIVASTTPQAPAHLLGATATHVYLAYPGESPMFTPVRRLDRTTGAIQLFACATVTFMDAAVDPTGALFVADPSNVRRYDTPTTGTTCTAQTPATALVAGVATGEAMARVLVGPTRLVYVTTGVGGAKVHGVDSHGITAPISLGAMTITNTTQTTYPIAMDGDTVFWLDATTASSGQTPAIVASPADGSVQPIPLAGAPGGNVIAMAASPSAVVWIGQGGVFRIAR